MILSMQDQLSQLNADMERLIEQIADANNKRYGRSSEKLDVIAGQLELELIFNEAEALTETLYVVEPAEEDVIQVRRRKRKGKREEDLKDLPVEVVPHTLSEEKLRELFGDNGWKQLPDEVYKRDVDIIPQEFLRNDIHISKQVMANWMIQCADRYLGILYDYLHKELYYFHVLQADGTPVMVSKDGRPANSKSYMWIYRTGKVYQDTPIILYEYQRTRKADHPREFLKDFAGVVVCDGYCAYRKLDRENPDIIFAGCWTHARRYFSDALKALPKAAQKAANDTVAYEALKRIGAIYHLDNQLSDLKPDERKKQRQMTVKPLTEAFFAWAKEIQSSGHLSKGKTQEGINYCINQEEVLNVFLNDGEVPLDNNVTEGALRSFCLHKHAWKLIDSIDGAKSSAIIYSITETAKENNLNPFRFLTHILTILKDHQDDTDYSFIEELLPWSNQLPEICRSKSKTTNM